MPINFISRSGTKSVTSEDSGQLSTRSLILTWVQTNAYVAGAIVERNGVLYKAAGAIPANTAFATGTSGAKWIALSPASTQPSMYVSPAADSDSADGTFSKPYATIGHALKNADSFVTNFTGGTAVFVNALNIILLPGTHTKVSTTTGTGIAQQTIALTMSNYSTIHFIGLGAEHTIVAPVTGSTPVWTKLTCNATTGKSLEYTGIDLQTRFAAFDTIFDQKWVNCYFQTIPLSATGGATNDSYARDEIFENCEIYGPGTYYTHTNSGSAININTSAVAKYEFTRCKFRRNSFAANSGYFKAYRGFTFRSCIFETGLEIVQNIGSSALNTFGLIDTSFAVPYSASEPHFLKTSGALGVRTFVDFVGVSTVQRQNSYKKTISLANANYRVKFVDSVFDYKNSVLTNTVNDVSDSDSSFVSDAITTRQVTFTANNKTEDYVGLEDLKVLVMDSERLIRQATIKGNVNIYDSDIAYKKNSVVVYNDSLYIANTDRQKKGRGFVTSASDSETWRPLGNGGVIAEFGETLLSFGPPITATSEATAHTMGTINIPSAGTWEIDTHFRVMSKQSQGTWQAVAFLADGSGTKVVNSEVTPLVINNIITTTSVPVRATLQATGSGTARITTTGPATYTVRVWMPYSDGVGDAYVSNDAAGRSKAAWKKISGYAPVTGVTTSYSSVVFTQNIVANTPADFSTVTSSVGNITFNSGFWLLTAGVTYEFMASFSFDAGGSNASTGDVAIAFVDSTTNASIGTNATSISTTFSDRGLSRNNVSTFIYTPTTNQTIKLRATFVGGTSSGTVVLQSVINQIGTTSVSGFLGTMSNDYNISNTYPLGTVVVKDTVLYRANANVPLGTTFTKGTSGATWQQVAVPETTTEALTITGTTSNPTKATTREKDFITLFDNGSGWCDVELGYRAVSATGAAVGSGGYLFTLPAGYQFNSTHHSFASGDTTILNLGSAHAIIGGSEGVVSNGSVTGSLKVVPFSATKFFLMVGFSLSNNAATLNFLRSDYFSLTGANTSFTASFRFKKV